MLWVCLRLLLVLTLPRVKHGADLQEIYYRDYRMSWKIIKAPPPHAAHTVVMGVCECEVHIISRLQ